MIKPYCGVEEGAALIGWSVYKVRQGVRSGKIPCEKSGPVYLINLPLWLNQLGIPIEWFLSQDNNVGNEKRPGTGWSPVARPGMKR